MMKVILLIVFIIASLSVIQCFESFNKFQAIRFLELEGNGRIERPGKCPTGIKTVSVDVDKIEGLWNMILRTRFFRTNPERLTCVAANFTKDANPDANGNNGFTYKITGQVRRTGINSQSQNILFNGKCLRDANSTGTLNCVEGDKNEKIKELMLAFNDKYMVPYDCHDYADRNTHSVCVEVYVKNGQELSRRELREIRNTIRDNVKPREELQGVRCRNRRRF